MDMQFTDKLINFAPPSSSIICLSTDGSISAQHDEHRHDDISIEPAGKCVTSNGRGQLDAFSDQSFVTAPELDLEKEANAYCKSNHTDLNRDESPENYKRRAECFALFKEIQGVLQDQFHQIQTLLIDGELPEEETEINLLLAVRALSSSLVAVRHILKGTMTMMEASSMAPSLSQAVNPSSGSPVQSPVQSPSPEMSDSHADSVRTGDDLSDLLLGCDSSDVDITGHTDVDIPDDQPAKVRGAASPGADRFVNTQQRDIADTELLAGQLELKFHPDFTQLSYGKLYVPSMGTNALIEMQSRRVILKNLPPDATLSQIIRGIPYEGRLMSINILNTAPIFGNSTKTAMLAFEYPKLAADLACAVQSSPPIYEAKNGDQYRAEAWLIPSPSFVPSWADYELLRLGRTRSLHLAGFPKECIWYFISAFGVNNIVCVDYDESANRADKLISTGKFSDFYQHAPLEGMTCTIIGDSCQEDANDCWPYRSLRKRLPEDDLEEWWNRYPYNDYVPPQLRNSAGFKGPTRLSVQERLALQYDIQESEVDDFLHDVENHRDTEFRIIGSSITLTRRKWGWSMKTEDETKLLMATTLHEPDWAEQWDEYFAARGEINRRTWEHYGMLAKHRREKAEEQGLGPEMVPVCSKGCEMGCRDIKATPVAPVVKKYFDTSKISVIRTDAVEIEEE
ncbi:nucleotide-binding, alpha-beta plait [Trichoderma arundinaceum]|uniref:Nucleotide-binding, alpha-beta plait n=1 Tax=Trichoderma arundinaceum TaxID=490622 RepID=A0A395N9T0_TRIAR|nr:nucleotide-binding, alpha-beta plait [Trichoderma arundinaceum]